VTELSEAELDALVEQAIVDAYGDDEQLVSLYTIIVDNLALPFTTTVLGFEASVESVDVTASGSSPSAYAARTVRRSRSSTSGSRSLCRPARSGSPRTGAGRGSERIRRASFGWPGRDAIAGGLLRYSGESPRRMPRCAFARSTSRG
jgi:hypothetical protein